jgi:hypothetical protein
MIDKSDTEIILEFLKACFSDGANIAKLMSITSSSMLAGTLKTVLFYLIEYGLIKGYY